MNGTGVFEHCLRRGHFKKDLARGYQARHCKMVLSLLIPTVKGQGTIGIRRNPIHSLCIAPPDFVHDQTQQKHTSCRTDKQNKTEHAKPPENPRMHPSPLQRRFLPSITAMCHLCHHSRSTPDRLPRPNPTVPLISSSRFPSLRGIYQCSPLLLLLLLPSSTPVVPEPRFLMRIDWTRCANVCPCMPRHLRASAAATTKAVGAYVSCGRTPTQYP